MNVNVLVDIVQGIESKGSFLLDFVWHLEDGGMFVTDFCERKWKTSTCAQCWKNRFTSSLHES